MPSNDCGFCDLLVNCGAQISNAKDFYTLAAKLLCEIADNTGGGLQDGWLKASYFGEKDTVQTVKSSAGTLGAYYIYNPNSSVAYVQIFDTAGAIVLGTTVPALSLGIPPGGAANVEFADGVVFSNSIKLAATTTANGLTPPTTGLDINIFYV